MVQSRSISRRDLLGSVPALAATSAVGATVSSARGQNADPAHTIQHGQIRQSVMGWCFNPMPTADLIGHCAAIGLAAIEGINPNFYPLAKQHGLGISLVGSHGFGSGPVNREHHAECVSRLKTAIDTAVKFDAPSVITFTGMTVNGMSDRMAEQNCLDCWKQIIGYAEERDVTIVLEHLNSRDDTHPMKGHPGYFGDDVERCLDLVRRMDSPRFKLLFDIYHVQVMNGDVIRRIQDNQEWIGHYHTAGNPGRGELDEHQEIYYPAVMRAILATGYQGYVAQEFIPTWKDPVSSLRHAAALCDVQHPV